ncbi:MAG: hypothetical protein L6R43_00595 [Planctomycetes bacterium]|nr:hypothetical protein [Planctomycetota bacterium]
MTEALAPHGFDSEIRVATERDPAHVLAYQAPYRAYRDHFLVTASYKLLRLWDAAPEERMFPAIIGNRLPTGWHAQLERGLRGSLSEEEIAGVSAMLHVGVIRQVHSFPVDLRVEREVAATLPEHADRQRAYFARQVQDLLPHFSLAAQPYVRGTAVTACAVRQVALMERILESRGLDELQAVRLRALEAVYVPQGAR